MVAPKGSWARRRQTADVVRGYTSGAQSIRGIAEATDMSYGKVQRLLVESGTPRRSRGVQPRSEFVAAEAARLERLPPPVTGEHAIVGPVAMLGVGRT